jgi:hypothetical protein
MEHHEARSRERVSILTLFSIPLALANKSPVLPGRMVSPPKDTRPLVRILLCIVNEGFGQVRLDGSIRSLPWPFAESSCSNAAASFESMVSNPSVNQP